jgi:hypothetical protein
VARHAVGRHAAPAENVPTNRATAPLPAALQPAEPVLAPVEVRPLPTVGAILKLISLVALAVIVVFFVVLPMAVLGLFFPTHRRSYIVRRG